MKHLKKYNENFDIDTIKDIFLELQDVGLKVSNETLYDYFGQNDFDPGTKVVVGERFEITLPFKNISNGNPYGGSEISISPLVSGISNLSEALSKSSSIITDNIERIQNAGFKITFYQFGFNKDGMIISLTISKL